MGSIERSQTRSRWERGSLTRTPSSAVSPSGLGLAWESPMLCITSLTTVGFMYSLSPPPRTLCAHLGVLSTILAVHVQQSDRCVFVCRCSDLWTKWPLTQMLDMVVHRGTGWVKFEGQGQGRMSRFTVARWKLFHCRPWMPWCDWKVKMKLGKPVMV